MKKNDFNEILKKDEIERKKAAKKYPIGTKLYQPNGPTGEIIAIKGNSDDIRTVRTAGVDRDALVRQIDVYVEIGKITIEEPK